MRRPRPGDDRRSAPIRPVYYRLNATGSFVRVLDGEVSVLQQARVRQALEALRRRAGEFEMVPVEERRSQ